MATKQAQAIAIKLSKARRSGKQVPPPTKGRYAKKTRQKAKRDLAVGRRRSSHRKAKARK